MTDDELEELGLRAARAIAGDAGVERVEVVRTVDRSDHPAYHFSLLVRPDDLMVSPGLLLGRLQRSLYDALAARGDDRVPMVRMVEAADWHRRALVPAL